MAEPIDESAPYRAALSVLDTQLEAHGGRRVHPQGEAPVQAGAVSGNEPTDDGHVRHHADGSNVVEADATEPAPAGVRDVMRSHGIDPATYVPPTTTSTNTVALAEAGAPDESSSRLLDMDLDAAIDAAQAAALAYDQMTGEHALTEEHASVAVTAALEYLAGLPYRVTLAGAPAEPTGDDERLDAIDGLLKWGDAVGGEVGGSFDISMCRKAVARDLRRVGVTDAEMSAAVRHGFRKEFARRRAVALSSPVPARPGPTEEDNRG